MPRGFQYGVLELDDFGNDARWPAHRDAMVEAGIAPCCWFTDGNNITRTPADAFLTVAECESESDRQGAIAGGSVIPSTVPFRGVICTLTPFGPSGVPDPALSKPLIDLGYLCFPECYMGESLNHAPDREDFMFREQLGWPRTYPVFGVYDAPLSMYEPYMSRWPKWSIYLAGYIL